MGQPGRDSALSRPATGVSDLPVYRRPVWKIFIEKMDNDLGQYLGAEIARRM